MSLNIRKVVEITPCQGCVAVPMGPPQHGKIQQSFSVLFTLRLITNANQREAKEEEHTGKQNRIDSLRLKMYIVLSTHTTTLSDTLSNTCWKVRVCETMWKKIELIYFFFLYMS